VNSLTSCVFSSLFAVWMMADRSLQWLRCAQHGLPDDPGCQLSEPGTGVVASVFARIDIGQLLSVDVGGVPHGRTLSQPIFGACRGRHDCHHHVCHGRPLWCATLRILRFF
jgi:hypothetical protein